MRRSLILALMLLMCGAFVMPAVAQQTTGNIAGRVTDQQSAALPGVTVTAKQAETGFTRSTITDGEGVFRLTGLLIGTYDLTIEMSGFTTLDRKGVVLNVSQTLNLDVQLKIAQVSETVTVTGETPLLETTSSSVGGVVDVNKIENLPLNGRQFANLAMTVAGVAMGFHSDPTKSTQQSPQIAGGNGRNVNYQIDGGDNNDDTVGGLLQLYPLEAIQEFNFITQRYKAEYGRSNGGVMNIVTKSGTNAFKGSFFTAFRDKSLNARTETQILANVPKQDYRRYQYGGSFGGPIVQNKAHFFAAFERTQQDTNQTVNTLGLFPSLDGTYPTPVRENLFTVKSSITLSPSQFLTVRYGRNTNSQVYGVSTRSVPENWGDSTNTFNSINVNHNWVLGGSKLNEFIFQYADFANYILARTGNPQENFANGVTIGYNVNTPQTTIQHKFQFRDDFSWHKTGWGGLGHDFKAGVNFINEPKLYVTFNSGSTDYAYTHVDNNPAGPISAVTRSKSGSGANIPTKQWGVYFQDDWRLKDRITINAGLRYDLVTGFAINQTGVTNFDKLQAAGQSGLFNGVVGFQEWGPSSREDYNNIQPRVGMAWDVRGDGRDLIRAGWGIYYDFGYTNANILFPALSAQGGSGSIFTVTNTAGIKNPDGSFFTVGQPISNIASQNQINPAGPFFSTNVAVPRVRQPFTSQTSVGWSHEITRSTVIDADYVHVEGKDLGVRWALNTITAAGTRRYASLGLSPANPTMNMSIGASKFDGFNIGVRRRMDQGGPVERLVSVVECQGPRRPGARRVDHEPRAGCDQPAGPRAVGAVGQDRRATQDHGERRHPATVGHLRLADLPVPLGAPAPRLDGLRRERRRHEQRHLHNGVPIHRNRRGGQPVLQGNWRVHDGQLRPRLGPVAVQPPRLEGVQAAAWHDGRGDRRGVQHVQRHQPQLRGWFGVQLALLHRHGGQPRREPGVHEADRVLG